MQKIVSKIFLNHIALITTANHKFIDAMGAKNLEDVPEDWPATDLHHRLGLEAGFFADAGAETTGKNDGFHNKNVLLERDGNDLMGRV